MSNLSCGTHVAEPSANKDCRKLLNQFCRFLPKLKLPISADAKLPLTLPNQRQYRFLIINTARKDTIINKDINSFDRFSCIINLALKDSSELLNKNNFGTVFTDDLYLYSICMIIRRRDDLFHINYYRTLGQEIFLQNKDAYPQEHSF